MTELFTKKRLIEMLQAMDEPDDRPVMLRIQGQAYMLYGLATIEIPLTSNGAPKPVLVLCDYLSYGQLEALSRTQGYKTQTSIDEAKK